MPHHPPPSLIIPHHPSSSPIICHPPPSCSSSFIIPHHPSSSPIIFIIPHHFHHPSSSSIIPHHPPSSSIIPHHPPSSPIIPLSSAVFIFVATQAGAGSSAATLTASSMVSAGASDQLASARELNVLASNQASETTALAKPKLQAEGPSPSQNPKTTSFVRRCPQRLPGCFLRAPQTNLPLRLSFKPGV